MLIHDSLWTKPRPNRPELARRFTLSYAKQAWEMGFRSRSESPGFRRRCNRNRNSVLATPVAMIDDKSPYRKLRTLQQQCKFQTSANA